MSIYAEKRNGKATGRWRVDVMRAGNSRKGRADSYAEAKELERAFIEDLKSPSDWSKQRNVSAQSHRLSHVIREAECSLWHGKSEAEKNFKKLRFVVDVLGDQPVDTVSTAEIDKLIARLRKAGPKGRPLDDSTINRYLSAVSKFLKWAIDREYRRTPLPKIEWLDEDDGRIRWIEPDEEAALCKALPDTCATVVRVAIKTGMRKSEIYELVEGEGAQLAPDHIHLWKTKNRTARSIPITPETYADIRHLRNAGMPTERQLRYEWDKAKEVIGVTDADFVFHSCRHTCATRMVQAGIDVLTIKKMLGHKSLQTTMRYAHVSAPDLRKALDKVNSLFG
jgi:integrase